eukprot:m.106487 g.106487  ORF g.106487 m.106487 type:complete len:127 (+) comp9154_c0_seq1:1332-1712(+)
MITSTTPYKNISYILKCSLSKNSPKEKTWLKLTSWTGCSSIHLLVPGFVEVGSRPVHILNMALTNIVVHMISSRERSVLIFGHTIVWRFEHGIRKRVTVALAKQSTLIVLCCVKVHLGGNLTAQSR